MKVLEQQWKRDWKTFYSRYTMFGINNADRKLLKYILTDIPEDKAKQMITYFLSNWDSLRDQFNIKDVLPTVRMMYYYRQQILGLMEYSQ